MTLPARTRNRAVQFGLALGLAFSLMFGTALADPSFGPGAGNGQGNNAPQDQGAGCHPPGQTSDLPQCR